MRGDIIQGMINRTEQVKMLKPKMVFLMAGINDVANISIKEFGKRFNTLVGNLLTIVPDAELILQSFYLLMIEIMLSVVQTSRFR